MSIPTPTAMWLLSCSESYRLCRCSQSIHRATELMHPARSVDCLGCIVTGVFVDNKSSRFPELDFGP